MEATTIADPDRAAQAERLGDYFALQLAFAEHMAGLKRLPLATAVARYTNFHKRFGLGDGGPDPSSPAWLDYIGPLVAHDAAADRLVWTKRFFAAQPPIALASNQTGFGCFACESPTEAGDLQIHFQNRELGLDDGPLSSARRSARMAELTAMFGFIRQTYPMARTVVGGSWLYNLEAYRRLFPPQYGASRRLPDGHVRLTGTSSWGQFIDHREAIKPEARDQFIATWASLDPDAPWRSFPLQAMRTRAPIELFFGFYDRAWR